MTASYIYIIGGEAPPYKVGISKDPKRRLKALQTGHPHVLKIHALKETTVSKVKQLETIIHRNIDNYKTHGEWFDLDLDKILLEVEFALIRYEDDPMLHCLAKDRVLFNRFR
jgi:hypothetical protein